MANKPHILVTNDDGIQSQFLHKLVTALAQDFRVTIAAPDDEQSWIGRAVTRRGQVEAFDHSQHFPHTEKAWAISGTPTDCVNIALGNLLPERPDAVLSGINVGFNTTETLILSSGTVAGAIEGAQWQLPAMALSISVPPKIFEQIRDTHGQTTGLEFDSAITAAADHGRKLAHQLLATPPKPGQVLNINFPSNTNQDSPVEDTFPAGLQLGSFYTEVAPNKFRFQYSDGIITDHHPQSDRIALQRGSISRSLLDFSKIGQRDQLTAKSTH